jgi:hypothetical protein
MSAKAVLRESGAVLRMSESQVASLADTQSEDQTMIINMGPQHPSTRPINGQNNGGWPEASITFQFLEKDAMPGRLLGKLFPRFQGHHLGH